MNQNKTVAFKNCMVLIDNDFVSDVTVVVKDGQISDVIKGFDLNDQSAQIVDLNGQYLVPGFIDLQVNGGGGAMFNSDPCVETIRTIGNAHRKYGTTGFLPTLISDDFAVMEKAIAAVDQAIKEGVPGVLGIHLEGPFLNKEKRGAHDANKFCSIGDRGFELITSLTQGKTIVTLAPELTTPEMITKLSKHGVVVCAGHSAATYEQACRGIDAGVTGVTHLYNAMIQLGSREPGLVGAAISRDETWFGVIADGFHVHDASLKIAIRAKRRGGAVLVTDAMASVGSIDKSFILNGEKIYAVDGRCVNSKGSLAGSDLDMISAIKNVINSADLTIEEAVRMASLYPAKALGLDGELGRIAPGYRANLVALSPNLDVVKTWIDGDPSDSPFVNW